MIAAAHRTRDGYILTATMRTADGTLIDLTEKGPELEETRARLLARIDAWIVKLEEQAQ